MRILILLTLTLVSSTFGQPLPGRAAAVGQASEQQTVDSSQAFADRIVGSKIPVLIDFWAPWCGPCRFLGPTIEELKKEYAGKILVMKINVDVHRALAAYFKISSIPAVFLINNKAVVQYLPGLQPKESYKQAIDKVLSGSGKPGDGETQRQAAKQPISGKASSSGKPTPATDE